MNSKHEEDQSYSVSQEEQDNNCTKTKRVCKEDKKSKNNKKNKGKDQDIKKPRETEKFEKMYWLATIKYLMQNKLQKISWGNTKPDKFFVKIQQYFQGQRTKIQIKSLDQRLKKKYYQNPSKKLDITQAIKVALPQHKLSQQQKTLLTEYITKYDQQNIWKIQFSQELAKSAEQRQKEYQVLKKMLRSLDDGGKIGVGGEGEFDF